VENARRADKAPPISVAVTKSERAAFEAEARRRGLGVSTTIRSLAFERANELRLERQRERALRWQTERLHGLIDLIERKGFEEASQEQIDALFDQGRSGSRRTLATGR
jgi:hypothetical protein